MAPWVFIESVRPCPLLCVLDKRARNKPIHMFLWRRKWQPTPVLLPGNSHGRRSLVGCSPRGREESDMTEWLHFGFSLSCIGEGNGNPLQCSCLENPWDGGAWWAAVCGVAQSRTQLKQLSSSSRTYLKPFSQLCVSSIHRQLLWETQMENKASEKCLKW